MTRKSTDRRRIAITVGDPCGIGPEIVIKLLNQLKPRTPLIVVGSRSSLESVTHLAAPFSASSKEPLQLLEISENGPFKPGKICRKGGKAAIEAIEVAHRLCTEGVAAAMVTGPIGKEAIRMAGSRFSGHTDMLCALCNAAETKMAMVFGRLRVVMTTLHVSYREALNLLSRERVLSTIRLGCEAFNRAGNKSFSIAVGGINPHAGENSLFGDEEARFITPAINDFKEMRVAEISGPWPVDSLFKKEMREKHDLFITHTHDHGLAVIKALGGTRCVNVTLGLPYIRTSVGHGTAYDIAGRSTADPAGLKAAITQAEKMLGDTA